MESRKTKKQEVDDIWKGMSLSQVLSTGPNQP